MTLRARIWCDQRGLNPTAQKSSAATLAQMFEPIRDDLREVEREFARHVQSQVSLIPTIGNYIQDGGGKRIRPAVLLMAARMAGYTGDLAVLYASVIEFIHTATLVHDDIIDESELRRGREAVHTKWGNHVTVLFGDFLYLKSMSLALSQDRLEIIRLLCDVTLRIVEGEIYQLTKNGVVDLTEEEHFDIVRRKTAYLFAGCARIGGMLGTDDARAAGRAVGLRPEHRHGVPDRGRPAGLHRRRGRARQAGRRRPARRQDDAAGDSPAAARRRRARRLVRGASSTRARRRSRSGASCAGCSAQARSIDYAQRVAVDFVERAKKALYAFPASDARDALMFLPDYVISRDR